MSDGTLVAPPRPPLPPPSDEIAFDHPPLPIPPLDPLFFSSGGDNFPSDLPLTFEDSYDFDITFDDLDDIYLPSETEPFLLPVQPNSGSDAALNSSTDSGKSEISGDHCSDIDKYLNCSPSESCSCNSGDRSFAADQVMNIHSPVSSQGSGNCGSRSGVSEAMNAGSPDSANLIVVDQKIKLEEANPKSGLLPKRKKENGEEAEMRSQKYRRSETVGLDSNANDVGTQQCGGLSGEEEKRRAKLMRNRESAQLSRQRKKHYVEELEDKVRNMHSTIAELNGKISYFMAENASLRQQLGGSGMCPPPVYPPMAPVGYPWMPCAPYVVKQQGSQVPLVPIPRLKPQQPVPAVKARKGESKKTEGRTKKVASVSFLGLVFFILLFGGLVPIVDFKFGGREGGSNGLSFFNERFYDQSRGSVLIIDDNLNGSHGNTDVGSSTGKYSVGNRIHCDRGRNGCSEFDMEKKGGSEHLPGSRESVRARDNASEPLVASLYVPRNDKLVKIDGNLIIHSVMASERAMASHNTPEVDIKKETGLAIPKQFSAALAIPDVGTNRGRHPHQSYPTSTERQKALTSGNADSLKDHLKVSAANGKLQQWFHEGLAGPMLSSGMCSEVFQFDVSPGPGAIVPSSVTNITTKHRHNATHNGKNRRILRGLPFPLTGSDLNNTEKHIGRNSQKDDFQGNKSVSSMVVSILADPREAGDGDVDSTVKTKSLSRIFVVVLLDSVKYVTYSCMLPWSSPQLVTT